MGWRNVFTHQQIREGGTHRWCVFLGNLPALKPTKNDRSASHSRRRQISRNNSMMKTPLQHQQQAGARSHRVTAWAGRGRSLGRGLIESCWLRLFHAPSAGGTHPGPLTRALEGGATERKQLMCHLTLVTPSRGRLRNYNWIIIIL